VDLWLYFEMGRVLVSFVGYANESRARSGDLESGICSL